MSRLPKEPPYEADLRWVETPNTDCRQCGKRGYGILMDAHNSSYGWHCKSCADKRLAAAKRYREWNAAKKAQP